MTYREEQPVPNPCDVPPKPVSDRPDKDDMRHNIDKARKDMDNVTRRIGKD